MFMFKVAFSSFSNISQSACSTLYRVLNSQSDVDRALCKHHCEFRALEDNSHANMPWWIL